MQADAGCYHCRANYPRRVTLGKQIKIEDNFREPNMRGVLWILVGLTLVAAVVALYVSSGIHASGGTKDVLQILAATSVLTAVALTYLLVRN